MSWLRLALLILMGLFARDTYAQTDNRFAIGVDYVVRAPDHAAGEDYAHGKLGPGPMWRFGTTKTGWGFHWGFNWYAARLDRVIGGSSVELGQLEVRPFMAGYGYSYGIQRHTTITAAVLGGYALGSLHLEQGAVDAYTRLGQQSAVAKASGTPVLKPELGVWYNLSRRVGLNVNAGYMIARPEVSISTSAGVDRHKARADEFILRVGTVFSLF